jgi:predicted dehydrogenase
VTTDYTKYPLAYRLKKLSRYVSLYGVPRTLAKVRGQYHMRNTGSALETDWRNPAINDSGANIALIGCGNFAYSNIAYYCTRFRRGSIRCAYDPVGQRAISLIRRYAGVYAARDPFAAIEDSAVETVFIASNHSTHAEYAIHAIRCGKTVHIEKPHVVSRAQLSDLIRACKDHPESKVFLGFNRPRSIHFRRLMRVLGDEAGPSMINWFIAGHALDPDHWYFSDEEGGRILGNLCHWTDLTLRMVGVDRAFPIKVSGLKPTGSESDYVVTMEFADSSLAVISFSAKGHTFEGVREYLNVHKGNALATLMDFYSSITDVGDRKTRYRSWRRDHGHRAAIEATLAASEPESLAMIAESANLFLGVREAVEAGVPVSLESAWR